MRNTRKNGRLTACLLVLALMLSSFPAAFAEESSHKWWQDTVVYQIYPLSFQDTDDNGTGDLKGIDMMSISRSYSEPRSM